MHFLDEGAVGMGHEEPRSRGSERTRARTAAAGSSSGAIVGVTLPAILEAHRQQERHAGLAARRPPGERIGVAGGVESVHRGIDPHGGALR